MSQPAWRCGTAARWLPRALGGAVLAAGTVAALAITSEAASPLAGRVRALLVVAAGAVALWVVRKGGEVRLTVAVERDRVVFRLGRRREDLSFDDIANLRYEPPFFASRAAWLPALAIVDRQGECWRVPALIEEGRSLVERLLEASDREDLRSWADAFDLRRRMGGERRRIVIGYATAGLIVLVAALVVLR